MRLHVKYMILTKHKTFPINNIYVKYKTYNIITMYQLFRISLIVTWHSLTNHAMSRVEILKPNNNKRLCHFNKKSTPCSLKIQFRIKNGIEVSKLDHVRVQLGYLWYTFHQFSKFWRHLKILFRILLELAYQYILIADTDSYSLGTSSEKSEVEIFESCSMIQNTIFEN